MRPLVPLALLGLPSLALSQSVVVPDSTVRTVMALAAADGELQTAGFMDLDQGALPTNRPYQVVAVGNELWTTDDVLGQVRRWDATGSVQLGSIDLSPNRLRGMCVGFGSIWVAGGTPSLTVQDWLFELSPAGAVLHSYPMPSLINGLAVHGSELLLAANDTDDVLRVDPTTGQVLGLFHDSDGINSYDAPGQIAVRPNGNVLVASGLPPGGIFEFDAAGNPLGFVDVEALIGGSVVGVWPLDNGDLAFSSGQGVYVHHAATNTVETKVTTVTAYYFSEIPDVLLGTTECSPAVTNSSGLPATIAATGRQSAGTNHFRLSAQQMPMAQFGYFLCSQTPGFVPNPGGQQGNLCLSGLIGRFNQSAQIQFTGNDDFFSLTVDTSALPTPSGFTSVVAGQTWRFQCWYRDLNPGATSNFTDVVAVTFQ